MNKLGISASQPSDWERSKAFYLRLTIVPSTRVSRPETHYPCLRAPPSSGSKNALIMRHELLDLGHVSTYEELCKFKVIIYSFQTSNSGTKLNTDYSRICESNLFVVRVKNSNPTIWQRHSPGHRMLLRVPAPFTDSYPTLQEWELDPTSHSQTVRLDFLERISMPPTTPYESAAYFDKFRAATIGGFSRSVIKEIQRYHMLDKVFTRDESLQVLRELDFFKRSNSDGGWHQFLVQVDASPAPELAARVVVPELLDMVEEIPIANLSAETLSTLHDMRHRRYRQRQRGQRGKISYNSSPKFIPAVLVQPGHQLTVATQPLVPARVAATNSSGALDDSSGFLQSLADSTTTELIDEIVSLYIVIYFSLFFSCRIHKVKKP